MIVSPGDTQDRAGGIATPAAISSHEVRDIPPAAAIAYDDTEEVYAYGRLLGRLLEWHGGLNTPRRNTSTVRALDAEGAYWLTEVRQLLIDGPLSAIPDLLEASAILTPLH